MNARYYFEHVYFKNLFYKDPVKVITKLLTEKNKYLNKLISNAYKEKEEAPANISYNIYNESYDQFEFIIIDIPYANNNFECYKIILAYSFNLDLFQYFTVEYNKNGNNVYKSLCSWVEDNHLVLEDLLDEDLLDIKKKIYQSLMVN